MGQSYSELSTAKLELEYLRVEPYLTVYGAVEENLAVKEKMSQLETTVETLSGRVEELRLKSQIMEKENTALRTGWQEILGQLDRLDEMIRARDGELAKQWDRAQLQALAVEEEKKMLLERLEAVEKKEKEK
jgi:chromosome segregation ATPase